MRSTARPSSGSGGARWRRASRRSTAAWTRWTRSSEWCPSGTSAASEFGELQRAIWRQQFEALRDGDRFFYLNDPALPAIRALFGIDYRRTLGQVIEANTNLDVQPNVFEVVPD